MTRKVLLASLLIAVSAPAVPAQTRCGVERWPVKIGADDDIALVDTVPSAISVAQLTEITRPNASFDARRRVGPVELQTFSLSARLVRVIAQDDGDLHLVLRDLIQDDLTIVAEVPSGRCTADPAMGARFEDARQALRGTPRGGIVEITGMGFWDYMHGQSGMARNGLEIHPVLSLRVVR